MHHPDRPYRPSQGVFNLYRGWLLIALLAGAPGAFADSSGVSIQWERHPAPAPRVQLPDIASEVAKSMEAALVRQDDTPESQPAAPSPSAEPSPEQRPMPRMVRKAPRTPVPVPEQTITIRVADDIDVLEQTLVAAKRQSEKTAN